MNLSGRKIQAISSEQSGLRYPEIRAQQGTGKEGAQLLGRMSWKYTHM